MNTNYYKERCLKLEDLAKRKLEIELLNSELSKLKYSNYLKGFYYYSKRITILLLAVLTIGFAVYLLFIPTEAIDKKIKEEVKQEYKAEFKELAGVTFIDSFFKIKDGRMSEDSFINNLEKSLDLTIEKKVEKDFKYILIYISFLIFLFGLFLLYISRLTRKLYKRNRLLNKANVLTQNILQEYKLMIEEVQKETTLT